MQEVHGDFVDFLLVKERVFQAIGPNDDIHHGIHAFPTLREITTLVVQLCEVVERQKFQDTVVLDVRTDEYLESPLV